MTDNYPQYKTKVFVDSNIILEAKELQDLPWTEIDPVGPILILVVPTVLEEVDSKKRDGRLAPRARAFNRSLSPLLNGDAVINVTNDLVQVDLAIAECDRINWDQHADLDPKQGDHRVAAEVLNVRGVPSGQRVIIGQDIKPLIIAKRHGIRTCHVSESWLPSPEPSPMDKKVAELQQRIKGYERTEPEFEVQFSMEQQAVIYLVEPLSEEESALFLERILDANPEPVQTSSFMPMSMDGTLARRYSSYADETLPDFVRNYAEKMELLLGQLPIKLNIRNSGNLRADNVIVSIRAIGGWFNDKPIVVPPHGPAAPTARMFDPVHMARVAVPYVGRVGKHEFDVDEPHRTSTFEARCEDFRHGTVWQFDGVMWLDPHSDAARLVVVEITAANLRGKVTRTFPFQVKAETLKASDLLKSEPIAVLKRSAVYPLVERAFDDEEFSAIEWDGVEQD